MAGTAWNRLSSFGLDLLSPGILSSQDGPVLGAVGSFGWSGGAFLYPPDKSPTFINMSQENVDMRDSYLGEKSLWMGHRWEMSCLGRTGAQGLGRKTLC